MKLKAQFRPRLVFTAATAVFAASLATGCHQTRAPGAGFVQNDTRYAVEVLANAGAHGFASDAFQQQELIRLSDSKDSGDRSRRDLMLRGALIAYAQSMHGQAMSRDAFQSDWGLRPDRYDAEAELDAALAAGKLKPWLKAQAPQSETYVALQQGYLTYRKIADEGGWPTMPGGKGVTLGAADPQVQILRTRLNAEDASVPLGDGPADAALSAAVARFQTAHGLEPTGAVDKATLRELDVPASVRAEQIRANLERLRWLPRETPATRIDVNTAAATFDYFIDGRPALHMLTASGRPGDETPMLASKIDSIVLNPPWNVPDGIAEKELYPKEAADPGYLAAHNYAVSGNGSRLVQAPSPDSALGLVKFDFKNPYSVYLHDTPSKAAFSRTDRAVSHGCVRLEHAMELAKLVLSRQGGWSAERIDAVIASGETTRVPVKEPIPVRLVYLTAFPQDGRIAFRPDVYGWDAELLKRLDRASAGRSVALALPGHSRKTAKAA